MELFKKLTSKKKSKKTTEKQPPTPQQPTSQQPVLHEPNPNAPAPKGILKNANDAKKYSNLDAYPTSDDIDESLRNAQKNSSLNQSIGTTQENTTSPSPQNEEQKLEPSPPKKSNHNNLEKKQKDLKWDEANLEKNEKEKVPRMKIDEPPTPFAEMPEELRNDYDEHEDVEEVILDDLNPMEMSLDEQHEPDLESGDMAQSVQEINSKKTLDQQQQALLLQDEEYRQKMVRDALNRRDENHIESKQKIVKSAWEDDEDEQGTPDINKTDTNGQDELSEDEKKKAAFKKKRKAHYNEFHAIKAWRSKKDDIE